VDAGTPQRVDAVSRRLVEFIVDDLEWDGSREALLSDDQPVSLPEILDSTDLLELASFLEDEFGVVIDDADIVGDTFESVAALAALVLEKQDQQHPGSDSSA